MIDLDSTNLSKVEWSLSPTSLILMYFRNYPRRQELAKEAHFATRKIW